MPHQKDIPYNTLPTLPPICDLEQGGIIRDFVFQRDYGFSSPSAAASVILGNSNNGRVVWKTAEGTKLGDM